jgi:hypothetical protein
VVAGCRLVGCSVVSRLPICSLAVVGVSHRVCVSLGEEERGGVRSGPGEARTILLLHIISARPSKQPLLVRALIKVYMDLGSYFGSARTNKRLHHSLGGGGCRARESGTCMTGWVGPRHLADVRGSPQKMRSQWVPVVQRQVPRSP